MNKFGSPFLLTFLVFVLTSCTQDRNNPEEIRKQAADATSEIKKESDAAVKDLKKDAKVLGQDARAAAEGVREGLNRDDGNPHKPEKKNHPSADQ